VAAVKGSYLDKAFEFIKQRETNKLPNTDFVRFNQDELEWEIVDIVKEIRSLKASESSTIRNTPGEK